MLTKLINIAFTSGQTLKSWRKAIVSMIQKKKEDGTFTSLILICTARIRQNCIQNFSKSLGRAASIKSACNEQAQRAFLKDGCTSQCISIALNVSKILK